MTFLKKLGCLLSASAFIACSSVPAGAATLSGENASASVNVTAKYSSGTVTDIYSVDIQWGSMVFEYTDESRVWNPEKHKYDVTGASWRCEDGANNVKVTNHSNNPITVELSYTPLNNYSEIRGTFDVASKTLDAAEENSELESAPNFTASLTLTGELSETVTASTVIGSAKVTLISDTDNEEDAGNGGNESGGSGEMNTSREVGFINVSSYAEGVDYSYTTPIYDQGDNVYMAELFAENVLPKEDKHKTVIKINDTNYYIYEPGLDYEFDPGSTVNIRDTFYIDEGFNYERRKIIAIEAGKRYRLTITLNENGTAGEATLTETGS